MPQLPEQTDLSKLIACRQRLGRAAVAGTCYGLLVFRDKQEPLLITADRRDEWAYQAAFQFAAARLRSDQVIIR